MSWVNWFSEQMQRFAGELEAHADPNHQTSPDHEGRLDDAAGLCRRILCVLGKHTQRRKYKTVGGHVSALRPAGWRRLLDANCVAFISIVHSVPFTELSSSIAGGSSDGVRH